MSPNDLTITEVRSSGAKQSETRRLTLSGSNSRSEYRDHNGELKAMIINSEVRRYFNCNLDRKIFTSVRLDETGRPIQVQRRNRQGPKLKPPSETVFVQLQTVETGERKEFFRKYLARHVIISATRKYSAGGIERRKETIQQDGWFINPPVGRNELASSPAAMFIGISGNAPYEVEITEDGPRERGFPVFLETTYMAPGNVPFVEQIEVVQLSEASLDPSLFFSPRGCQRVMQMPGQRSYSAAAGLRLRWEFLKESILFDLFHC